MAFVWVFSFLSGGALASITVCDPSNVIPPVEWASDNALSANYNVPFISTQPSPLLAAHYFDGDNKTSLNHVTLSVDKNDTSVISVSDGSSLDLNYADIVKFGYSSNLLTASFYGFNAAINVANASTASLDHINITTHNGAANVYAYGTDTVVHVNNAWLYSSGPVSHGLYASGNGTIIGRNIEHFSGGYRSSSFSGDSPKGTIYVYDAVAHTQGIGSATFYALGDIFAHNVLSLNENAPVMFMDGVQNATLVNCNNTAGLLGGTVMFSSATRQTGGSLKLINSHLNIIDKTAPALWFGNTIATAVVESSKLNTMSGILVVANYSQVTQAFDYYASYVDNPDLLPAEATVKVSESELEGDLVAYNESSITFALSSYSSWTGMAKSGYGKAYFDVSLDKTSKWTMTGDTTVQNLTDQDTELSNIYSQGHTLYYNSSAVLSKWLKGKTISLSGGGKATPIAH